MLFFLFIDILYFGGENSLVKCSYGVVGWEMDMWVSNKGYLNLEERIYLSYIIYFL